MTTDSYLYNIFRETLIYVNPNLKHDTTVNQIGQIFRKYGFYTTRKYSSYKLKDSSEMTRRIDLVARKKKFRA